MSNLSTAAPPNSLRDEVFQLSESGGLSLSDITGDRKVQQVYRTLGRRSLYFLTKAILQYTRLDLKSHKPICDFIQDLSIRKGLVLLPRGVFKTTIGVIGFCIWVLINDPNRTILIANQVARHAERMLTEIENHLGGSNVLMNLFFPEIIKPNDKHRPWNQVEMDVPNKTMIRSTPSIMTIGVGARSESIHTDIQLNDDLVGIEDMFSEMNMGAALTWHDYERSLFVEPKLGIERVYGTRWPGNDIYKELIASGEYRVYWLPAKDEITGELHFPLIYDDIELRKLRDRNWLMFRANIQNTEVHPGSLEFKEKQLQYFKLLEDDKRGLYCRVDSKDKDKEGNFIFKDYVCSEGDIIITVDTAASGDLDQVDRNEIKKQRTQLSNNAIAVLMGHSNLYFQLDSWAGRAKGENPELQVAAKLMEIANQWKGYFRKIYVEAFGAHGQFITIFNMVCRQNNMFFPIEPLPKGTKNSKRVRIRTTVGAAAQNGQILVRRNQDQFVTEFNAFPSGMMDTLDCFAWGIDQIRMPLSEMESKVTRRVLQERSNKRRRFIGRAGY